MSNREINRIQRKINNMGLSIKASIFINMRIISSIILFVFTLLTSSYGYIIAPLITLIYYISIEYIILDIGIKHYIKDIEAEALDFFPVFLIHLKGTRNVKKAIYFTTSIINNELSNCFKKALRDIEIGKSVEESLEKLKENIPSENIKTIITSIIEANRTGTNVEKTINHQLEYIEEKKRKNLLNKLRVVPLKIAIVSIIFLFLIIMILIFVKKYIV